jgi:hypothetical protein
MASYTIPNAPRQLDMTTFKAFSESQGGLAKSCRFVAVIRPIGALIVNNTDIARDLMYLTEVAEMPGRGFMSADVRYYGPNQKFPFQSQYEDINMTFVCRSQSRERQFFDDWQWYISPNNTFDFNYKDEYRAEIDLYQYSEIDKDNVDEDGKPRSRPRVGGGPSVEYMFSLQDAFPILVNPQPVSWADDQFTRLGVTFSYSWWKRKDWEPGPAVSSANASFSLTPTGENLNYSPSMSQRTRLSYDT